MILYGKDTRENIEGLLEYCIEAKVKGIICFGMGLTLREGNREYFFGKLEEHFPGLRVKYQKKYGLSYEVKSDHNDMLMECFRNTCKKHNIMYHVEEVFSYLHNFPETKNYTQMSLFPS